MCNDCFNFENVKKSKENRIRDVLTANNIPFEQDKRVEYGCSLKRPDFVIDCGTHIIIVEVDENQHNTYACKCEQTRMINVFQDFGGMPVVFICYNPDNYVDSNLKKQKTNHSRENRLLSVISSCRLHIPKTYLRVI